MKPLNLPDTLNWMPIIRQAYEIDAETWSEQGLKIVRIGGGGNNALFKVTQEDVSYACKLFVSDGRHRAWREYATLNLLDRVGLDIAPQPVWFDESCTTLPHPLVVYRWLLGSPPGPTLTADQLSALLESIHRLHDCRPEDFQDPGILEAWFHWFDFKPYQDELIDLMNVYGFWLKSNIPDGEKIFVRLVRLVEACNQYFRKIDLDPGRESVKMSLCRVDPNLANTVWSPNGSIRWVDWEYSGWGDPALELAEIRWHASFENLGDAQHTWLRINYQPCEDDHDFQARVTAWDHLLAVRWPLLIARWLWSEQNGADRERLTHLQVDQSGQRARLENYLARAEALYS
jgi:thiamine kinase-like enzyme